MLIIEDQASIRLLLNEVFSGEGYEVIEAESGQQALQHIEKFQSDIILLDMKLPGISGLEILQRCKQRTAQAKVVMMTAYGELDLIREAKALGAIGHFSKPFDIDELKLYVNSLFDDVII
jgi:two-component system response regulator (stage 0 sporulation protein F)